MLEIHSNSNKHFEILGRSAEKIHLYLDKQGWRNPGSDQLLPRENIACVCVRAHVCVCVCFLLWLRL